MNKLFFNKLVIFLLCLFILTGCMKKSVNVSFDSQGGSEVLNVVLKSGDYLNAPESPTKEGYIFEGWYLGDDKFNFENKVTSDLNLIAKWSKVDISSESDEEKDNKEEVTTTTKKKKSTKINVKSTTKKIENKTSKVIKNSSTTTSQSIKKNINTSKKVSSSTSSFTSTTSITTTSTTSIPTQVISTTLPISTKVNKVNLKISVDDENNKVKIDKVSDINDGNVSTSLSSDEINEIFLSDFKKWNVVNTNGIKPIISTNIDEIIIDDKCDKSFSFTYVKDENTNELGDFGIIKVEDGYELKKNTVLVNVSGEDSISKDYYVDLETAINVSKDNDVIVLLDNQVVNNILNINKNVSIKSLDYNLFNIKCNSDYLFNLISDDNSKDLILDLCNLSIDCNSLVNGNIDSFKNILITHSVISYKNDILFDDNIKKIVISDDVKFNKSL